MSRLVARRADLALECGYHSPQVPADVRLNTNESPLPPPERWRDELAGELEKIDFNRYPDRHAAHLRAELARRHGVRPEEVFCANGSNEVLQCLLLAFGGPGRRAVTFEPTYALHTHISRITGTEVVSGERREDFTVDPDAGERLLADAGPAVTFLCSPNNPTGRAEPPDLVRRVLARAPGLVVVDEAYGQFAPWSALELEPGRDGDTAGLVVVRTFSKTWSMAAARLGYLVASKEVVAGCEAVVLPYHLSALTQTAGILALRFEEEMAGRVALVSKERSRLAGALAELPLETWPSDANFILFRPKKRAAKEVWEALLARSVLVRDCSSWPALPECLRVTVGLPHENDRFLSALKESLG